ncbi:uncharacterized protein LOC123313916 [Coccinella septempunctata]|uniref:uncharacterized protein LOC123313916 n=1 Tax=Coccinella septempunctata TaxID=41139 RepID=UPI001D05EF4F|nr:uncharacterized protein LOC123313916 [Coccinella septempunctata]
MFEFSKWICLTSFVSLVVIESMGQRQYRDVQAEEKRIYEGAEDRQGRNLLDWIGLGTGANTDPYQARTNANCLNGDLAECFKSRALSTFEEFFSNSLYELSDNARVRRMPTPQLRQLSQEPFEFSEEPRAEDSEWDQLVKFASRKVEKFVMSTGLEMDFSNDVTEEGRYSPRFVDEIVDEIDVIEDKKDSIFRRKQLKKLFIPLLLVLKIFKLKLLLFLPLILGLASFKKFLGFLAILVPGAIAFFKFCKPNIHSNFGGPGNFHSGPQYSPAGIAFQSHQPEYAGQSFYGGHSGGGIHFRDDNHAQQLAYNGWNQYRSSGSDIEAETTSKKSILPDS